MEIVRATERNDDFIEKLYNIWEKSVRATHFFVSESEIIELSVHVKDALKNIPCLITAKENVDIIAFMGTCGQDIDMLFVHPKHIGKGVGSRLVRYALGNCSVSRVTVNEENHRARYFYEYLGFRAYKRTESDEQGKPHPILYMRY